jgi:hypothetical protein
MNFYVINYNGERIPVVANEDMTFRSTDGRNWSIRDGRICLDGEPLSPDEVSIGRPGPQDDPVVQSIHEFDEEEFPPLSYPIPSY